MNYDEGTTPEINLVRAKINLAKAELELLQKQLTHERKKLWERVPIGDLNAIAKMLGEPFYCLTDFDWEKGQFDMAARVEAGETKPNIGGYWDNDRFRSSTHVFVPRSVMAYIDSLATK